MVSIQPIQHPIGSIVLNESPKVIHDMNLRAEKYEIIDYLNQLTNRILVAVPQGEDRDTLLSDLKRSKELVPSLTVYVLDEV